MSDNYPISFHLKDKLIAYFTEDGKYHLVGTEEEIADIIKVFIKKKENNGFFSWIIKMLKGE